MSERARQFMPFAALRGYYDLVREGSKVIEPKRILSEEQLAALDEAARDLKKGQLVHVVHYEDFGYVTTEGRVEELSLTMKTLRLGKKKIDFGDVFELRILGNTKDEGV